MVLEIFEQLYVENNIINLILYVTESFFVYIKVEVFIIVNAETNIIIEELISYLNKIFSIKIDSCKIMMNIIKLSRKKYLESNRKNIIRKS